MTQPANAETLRTMLSNVLPGLRELRAPLAGGYLWLLTVWLVLGDELPTAREDKPAALDRLFRLEPVVSDLGLAFVATVAAYLVGSIAIDVQVQAGRWLIRSWRGLFVRFGLPLLARRLGVSIWSRRSDEEQTRYEAAQNIHERTVRLKLKSYLRLTQTGEKSSTRG